MKKLIAALVLTTATTSAFAEVKIEQVPLAVILQSSALAYSSKNAVNNGNPYAVLGVISAASSIAPNAGYNQTFSSVFYGNKKK